MTQRSRYWNSPSLGDSSEAPYDAPTEFAKVQAALAGTARLAGRSGVLMGVMSEYRPTIGAGQITVAPGTAFVDGTWHESDDDEVIVVPTPTVAARWDIVCLRKDWDLQTVRITRVAGTEGGGVPSLTLIDGDVWDFGLFIYQVGTGGAIVLRADEGRLYYPLPNTVTPECTVKRTTNQAIAIGGEIVSWESAVQIFDTMWSGAQPTRLTAARDGLYDIETFLYFAPTAFSHGFGYLFNGELFVSVAANIQILVDASDHTKVNYSTKVQLAKGDYIEVYAYQNSAGPSDILPLASVFLPWPRTTMRFIRPVGVT